MPSPQASWLLSRFQPKNESYHHFLFLLTE
jgi:hypothetical protein